MALLASPAAAGAAMDVLHSAAGQPPQPQPAWDVDGALADLLPDFDNITTVVAALEHDLSAGAWLAWWGSPPRTVWGRSPARTRC